MPYIKSYVAIANHFIADIINLKALATYITVSICIN